MKKINRLLWISGYPSAYTRKLHALLDRDRSLKIDYIFIPQNRAERQERAYEQNAISSAAHIFWDNQKKLCNRLIREYRSDPNAGILVCGIYPRILVWWIFNLRKTPCLKLYFSDSNIANPYTIRFFSRILHKLLLPIFDCFLTLGTNGAAFYRWILSPAVYAAKTIVHFPYAHDHTTFSAYSRQPIQPGEKIKFLYVGRLVGLKNISAVVDAAGLLVAQGLKNFVVTIVGDGPEKNNLVNQIQKFNLEDYCVLVGGKSSEEIIQVYPQHHIFILPSDWDQWGMVVNEAMSAGLPVITPFWVGAASDLVVDGLTGRRLLKNSGEAIASAMRWYLEHPQSIHDQSVQAQQQILRGSKTLEECHARIKALFP